MRGGTYTAQILSLNMAGTSWLSKVRIENYLTEQVWITPSTCVGDIAWSFEGNQAYVEMDGINVNAINCGDTPVITVVGCNNGTSNHIRWQNSEWIEAYVGAYLFDITGTCVGANEFTNLRLHSGWDSGGTCFPGFLPGNGFYVQSDNNVFDGLDISEWSGNGVQFYNGSGFTVSNNIWRNTKIHDFTYSADCQRFSGVLVANATGTLVYNNVIWGMGGSGESYGLYGFGGSNTAYYNNTVYGGGGYGLRIEPGITGSIVRNNIFHANLISNYTNLSGGTTASNNSTSTTNPDLVDPGGEDFHLNATSTANIDTGFDLSATFTTDIDGTAYGALFERGAYAFVGVSEEDCVSPCVDVISGGSLDGLSVTTGAINTTGANLIVMIVASHGATALPTSSKGGTVEPMTAYSDSGTDIRGYYIQNPSVGTGHTFAVPSNASTTYPAICVIALSGRATSSVLDQQSGNVDAGGGIATIQAGASVPTSANQVVVAGAHLFQSTGGTINGGFISPFGATAGWVNGLNAGCQLAYLQQTTAVSANPTWTLGGTHFAAGAVLGTFRVFADVALPPPVSGPPRFKFPVRIGVGE